MPDICMCNNFDCKKYNKCYRAQAKPNCWQSFATFDLKRDKCFVKILPKGLNYSPGDRVMVDKPKK